MKMFTTLMLCVSVFSVLAEKNKIYDVGDRPAFLIEQMKDSSLKDTLFACLEQSSQQTDFSIGHRGAPLNFPEHTVESYTAAAKMGAGVLECDVTFTKDKALVCRHSQCDLHSTTDILEKPTLAAKCSIPFTPYNEQSDQLASAKCCTSDITLSEFSTLQGRMDKVDPKATHIDAYLNNEKWPARGKLLTHKQSIALFNHLKVSMTPELKAADVPMPFKGMSQEHYASKMLQQYIEAGVSPNRVFPQSFSYKDIQYWQKHHAEFAKQLVYLDDRYDDPKFNHMEAQTWKPSMQALAKDGLSILAPPLWMLVTLDKDKIVPSSYAIAAKKAGLQIIPWSLERSGSLKQGGGWYYQSISVEISQEGDVYELLHVLAQEIGIKGIFTDWPGTVTYYDNCLNSKN